MKAFLLLCSFLFFMSCQQGEPSTPLDYKYADLKQPIACEGQNNALLNEALYSFEEDIKRNYDLEKQRENFAYARFLIPAFEGKAEFKRLPSKHSREILEKLMEANIILKREGAKSNLNYEHPAVVCIIDRLEDLQMKRAIKALLASNSMDPTLFDTRMRNKGRDLARQRYLASYVSLEAYYQQLATIDFTVTTQTEVQQ